MSGLKGQAIARGAHRTCMTAGRAAACEACLAIVDRIIDTKHQPTLAPASPAARTAAPVRLDVVSAAPTPQRVTTSA
jgi:hypothetical protein